MMDHIRKKDETRFTIRFNPADPRHQKTMDALNTAGRRKANLIAEAICDYLARYSRGESLVPLIQVNQAASHETSYGLVQTMGRVGLINTQEEIEPPTEPAIKTTETVFNEAGIAYMGDTAYSDDMRQTILGGLNMFNGQRQTET